MQVPVSFLRCILSSILLLALHSLVLAVPKWCPPECCAAGLGPSGGCPTACCKGPIRPGKGLSGAGVQVNAVARNALRPLIQELQTTRRLFMDRFRFLPGADGAQVLESQSRDLIQEIPPIPGDEMLTFWVISEVEASASSLSLVGEMVRAEGLLDEVEAAYLRLVALYPENLVLLDRLEKTKDKKEKVTGPPGGSPPGLGGGVPPGLGGGGPPGLGGGGPPGLGGP